MYTAKNIPINARSIKMIRPNIIAIYFCMYLCVTREAEILFRWSIHQLVMNNLNFLVCSVSLYHSKFNTTGIYSYLFPISTLHGRNIYCLHSKICMHYVFDVSLLFHLSLSILSIYWLKRRGNLIVFCVVPIHRM